MHDTIYLGRILDRTYQPSVFEKVVSINRSKIPESTKRCRPKRQPKGTVKAYALFSSEDLIDLTFSKEEANDWMKQDDEHEVKIFYIKEIKDELVSKSKRKAK